MKITCISDLHGLKPILPGGDLLIIAGDLTAMDTQKQIAEFFHWIQDQEYRKIIFIAGNHDNYFIYNVTAQWRVRTPEFECDYLCDSGTTFEGYKIWGSPWSLWFKGINPHCKAFTGNEALLAEKFNLIPSDTDILITHTPPFGILDTIYRCHDRWSAQVKKQHAGSKALSDKILTLNNLKLHVFGHIHQSHGLCHQYYMSEGIDDEPKPCGYLSVNASIVTDVYAPDNDPIDVELKCIKYNGLS